MAVAVAVALAVHQVMLQQQQVVVADAVITVQYQADREDPRKAESKGNRREDLPGNKKKVLNTFNATIRKLLLDKGHDLGHILLRNRPSLS